jgi:hypothetical protein
MHGVPMNAKRQRACRRLVRAALLGAGAIAPPMLRRRRSLAAALGTTKIYAIAGHNTSRGALQQRRALPLAVHRLLTHRRRARHRRAECGKPLMADGARR